MVNATDKGESLQIAVEALKSIVRQKQTAAYDEVEAWYLQEIASKALADVRSIEARISGTSEAPAPAAPPRIEAYVEWSYREDCFYPPRDFWHARMTIDDFSTEWCSWGPQKQYDLSDTLKATVEADLFEQYKPLLDALNAERCVSS